MSFQPPGGPPFPPPPPGGPPPPPPENPIPPQGYPGPQQPWQPQQPWPPPTKQRGNGWKWGLGALALLVVIGVTAAVTISVTRDGGGDGGPTPTGETFGVASADDKGPANIIAEDPSCAAWIPINNTLAQIEKKSWDKRDHSIPETEWTPELRAQYDEVSQAMRSAADQTVALVKATPHRVVRELYEQFIAYARGYVDALPTYTSLDNHLVGTVAATSMALVDVCGSITYGSAPARGPLVSAPPAPSDVAPLTDPENPQRYLTAEDPTCAEWDRLLHQFADDTRPWQALDPGTRASDWNAEQRSIVDAVIPQMKSFADDVEALGAKSSNPTLRDFATLAAQYRRAYAAALPSYTPGDAYLSSASANAGSTIYEACKAVGG